MAAQAPGWAKLFLAEYRVDTFAQWPFNDGCLCTPEQVMWKTIACDAEEPLSVKVDKTDLGGTDGLIQYKAASCVHFPTQMAKAGFIHCPGDNAPDVVQCFFCFKELEGWEPDDDPMEEHRKHSPSCVFLALQKDVADLKMHEFLKLQRERMKNYTKKLVMQKANDFGKYVSNVRSEINRLLK